MLSSTRGTAAARSPDGTPDRRGVLDRREFPVPIAGRMPTPGRSTESRRTETKGRRGRGSRAEETEDQKQVLIFNQNSNRW